MLPITIYAESTPNPSSMKFVSNTLLMENGSVEFTNPLEASSSPLAQQLFAFSGVKGVFITSNFITITKDKETDWFDITNILREFIRGYLASGEKIFTAPPEHSHQEDGPIITEPTKTASVNETEIEKQIINMLEEYVKPAVEQDGGAIYFRSFNEGVVTVALKGSCSGCPSSTLTLKAGIENLLKKMVPEVTSVVAEAE
jgi:NFU1 iron-sulfur cluster scaffold homolog, mitochondrial